MLKDSEAGWYNKFGYLIITLDNKSYVGHRCIYQYYHNIEILSPEIHIDHVDGNPSNNSFNNLRIATTSENICNTKIRLDNKTGIKGLSIFTNRRGKSSKTYWRARVSLHETTLSKLFEYSESGKNDAIEWLESTRQSLHGDFAKN